MKQLILGGARSGKSSLAEQLAIEVGAVSDQSRPHRVIYLATSDPQFNDGEMDERIAHHRHQRPSEWPTIEEPVQLGQALRNASANADCILVDCLTLWLTNLLMAGNEVLERERQALFDALVAIDTPIIMVSNEVGLGVVPMGELSRRYVDEAGRLHQAVATLCERVIFTAAGLPLVMKGPAL